MGSAGADAGDWAAALPAGGGAMRVRGARGQLPVTELEALELPAQSAQFITSAKRAMLPIWSWRSWPERTRRW